MYKFKKKQPIESNEIIELFAECKWFENLFKKNRHCETTDGICENTIICGQDIDCGSCS